MAACLWGAGLGGRPRARPGARPEATNDDPDKDRQLKMAKGDPKAMAGVVNENAYRKMTTLKVSELPSCEEGEGSSTV